MFRLQQSVHVYTADIKCKQHSFLRKSAPPEPKKKKKGPVPRPCGVCKRHDVERIQILRIDARVSQGKKPRHTWALIDIKS